MTTTALAPEGFDRELASGGLEVRTLPGVDRLEARAAGETKGIRGYGSVSGVSTTIEGFFSSWDEEVADGAWAKTIKEGDIRSMFNHDTNWLLGRTKAGTLTLSEDDTGLLYDVTINPEDPNALSVWAKVDRGDVSGSSVWFRIVRQEWTHPTKENGLERPKRKILEAQLFETGPVVFPAFEATTAGSRSLGVLDRVLRSLGVDRSGQRAAMASDLLADPGAVETELRAILDQRPELRDAVCSCATEGRAADAPDHGTPPSEHLPTPEYYLARARATATRSGLRIPGG